MRKPLVYYCISTIIGCISALLFFENGFIGAALMAASFLACTFFTIEYKKFNVIIVLFMVLSFSNYNLYFNSVDFINGEITLRVKEKDSYNYIGVFKGKKIILKGNLDNINEGDIITVKGDFQEISIYEKGIVGTYKVSALKIKAQDFVGKMYEFRRNIYKKYVKVIGEDKAAIVLAACFGDTTYIKIEDKEKFNRLGILHVVSVSGLHLAIIYKLLEGLGGLKTALPVSFIYVIFTGGEPATLRAFIMIIILKSAKRVFKNYDPYSALSLSAMILMFYKPYYITDIGFNLSFLSMLGIFLVYKKIRNKFIFLPENLNEAVSLSLSAQFLSAPYIIAVLNNFSIGFIPGNIFLIPIFSVMIVVGNISIAFINFSTIFNLFGKVLEVILTALEGGSQLLLYISPETLQVSSNWSVYIVLLYCSYLLFSSGKRKYIYLPLILIPLLFFENYKIIPEINYVKINYSNCVLFKYREHKVLIVEEKQNFAAQAKEFIKENKINEIFTLNYREQSIEIENFNIKVIKTSKDNSFDLIVRNGAEEKLLLFNGGEVVNPIYNNYDIIKLNLHSGNKKYDNLCSVRILFGRYYLKT